jgi:hypothetical protein
MNKRLRIHVLFLAVFFILPFMACDTGCSDDEDDGGGNIAGHTAEDFESAYTAYSAGLLAAAASTDSGDSAYNEIDMGTFICTYHFNDFTSSEYTLNGSLAISLLTDPMTYAGTITFTGGEVTSMVYDISITSGGDIKWHICYYFL